MKTKKENIFIYIAVALVFVGMIAAMCAPIKYTEIPEKQQEVQAESLYNVSYISLK